ncbi:MAG TPA: hypothetical protein VFG10_12195 [Saprospiraceae bacterium]|nr:hypothetical protein [Saprospiraceae bacterium]
MGTDWKIYQPRKLATLNSYKKDISKLLNFQFFTERIVNTKIENQNKTITLLNNNNLTTISKIFICKYPNSIDLIKLFDVNFFNIYNNISISNYEYIHRGDNISFSLRLNKTNNDINFNIGLPYLNKNKSINQTIDLVRHLNGTANFFFYRTDTEIIQDFTDLIELHFDKKYCDNIWTLERSGYRFKGTLSEKEKFEGNEAETWRAGAIYITFPPVLLLAYGLRKQGESIFIPLLEYFKNSVFEIYVNGTTPELFNQLSELNPLSIITSFYFLLSPNIIEEIYTFPDQYFDGDMVTLKFKELKFTKEEDFSFSYSIYGKNVDQMELWIEIDKNATDDYVQKVLNLFDHKLDYIGQE